MSSEQLVRVVSERDLIQDKNMMVYNHALRRIKGLCGIGAREASDPIGKLYLEKIENISVQIGRQTE